MSSFAKARVFSVHQEPKGFGPRAPKRVPGTVEGMRWSVDYVRVNRWFPDGTVAATDVHCSCGTEEAARALFMQLSRTENMLHVTMRADGDAVETARHEEPLPPRARLSLRTEAAGFSAGDIVVDGEGRRWYVHCMITRLLPGRKHELVELSLRERADGGECALLHPSQVTLTPTA